MKIDRKIEGRVCVSFDRVDFGQSEIRSQSFRESLIKRFTSMKFRGKSFAPFYGEGSVLMEIAE